MWIGYKILKNNKREFFYCIVKSKWINVITLVSNKREDGINMDLVENLQKQSSEVSIKEHARLTIYNKFSTLLTNFQVINKKLQS